MLCIIASDATTAIYLAALSAICAGEFFYMLRSDAKLPNEVLGIVASASFPLAMWLFGINGVVVMVSLFDGETTLPGASLLQVWRRTAPLTKSINENVDFHNKTVKLYRGSILTTRVKCFSGASPLHWKREGFAGTDLGGDPSRALVQPGTQMVRNSPN